MEGSCGKPKARKAEKAIKKQTFYFFIFKRNAVIPE
jgi:hypothetical protein